MRDFATTLLIALLLFGIPIGAAYFTTGWTPATKETVAIIAAIAAVAWLLYSKLDMIHRDIRRQ